ncbi:multicopper oxidase domain-containing protein [Nonomuraea ferruginea]
MYHCHILRHEDSGMMGQFVIVEPGTEHQVSRTITAHHHPSGLRPMPVR